ncbi:MAG TPA: hypothetical protein DD435_17015 [Cyanobacteria bacterium UBA8530]|nr:hypothetical protein [Cyanobacteria bacterium UBA8530]
MPIEKWAKGILLFGLTLGLAGCQLSALFQNVSNLGNKSNLTTPAHVTVRAPLTTPAYYRVQGLGDTTESLIAGVKVFCTSDRSINGTTDKNGKVVLEIPHAMANQVLIFEAAINQGNGNLTFSCFAKPGAQRVNEMGTASTLLVIKLGNEIRQFKKELKEVLPTLDITTTDGMVKKIKDEVTRDGKVPGDILDSLLKGEAGAAAAADGAALKAGIKMADAGKDFALQESLESFLLDNFYPLLNANWEYSLYSNTVSGVLSQEMTGEESNASLKMTLEYTLPGKEPQHESLDVGLTRSPDGITLVPQKDTLANLKIPAINGIVKQLGFDKNSTWTAYATVVAKVEQLLPSYQVRGNTYTHVVRISYHGKDAAGTPLDYEEYRAKDVGLIKLVRTDYTSLELVKFTKR